MKGCQTLNPINVPTLIPNLLIKNDFSSVGLCPPRGRAVSPWMEIHNNPMYVVPQAGSIKGVLFSTEIRQMLISSQMMWELRLVKQREMFLVTQGAAVKIKLTLNNIWKSVWGGFR